MINIKIIYQNPYYQNTHQTPKEHNEFIIGRQSQITMVLDRLLGNAEQIDPAEAREELDVVLIPDEKINVAFKLVRDMIAFTDKRIIFYDKQGITGKKKEYMSVPFKSITRFSVETGGTFDRDADLKVWVSGSKDPIERNLKKGGDVVPAVQRALALYVL